MRIDKGSALASAHPEVWVHRPETYTVVPLLDKVGPGVGQGAVSYGSVLHAFSAGCLGQRNPSVLPKPFDLHSTEASLVGSSSCSQ